MRTHRSFAVTAVAFTVLLAGCKKADSDQPLAFVPADTPYLAANLEAVPQESLDAWWTNAEQMLPMYEQMLDSALADADSAKASPMSVSVMRAVREELRGKLTREGLQSLGLSWSTRSALYGIGLVPVLRMELDNPDAFSAFIARVETRVGAKLPRMEVAGQAYWRLGSGQGKAVGLLALQGKHLVLTVAPAEPTDALLRAVLGIDRPEHNVLGAGTLGDFNTRLNFLPFGSGYLDSSRLVALLTGQRSAIETEFMAALDLDPKSLSVDAQCKTEYAAIARKIPRLSFGYSALDPKLVELRYVVELEPALAGEFSAVAAPVPGLGGKGAGMLNYGFGLDLNALVRFVGAQAAAVAAAPYQCKSLAPLNEGFAKLNTELSNPAVFMAGAAVKGLNLSLSKVELPTQGQPVVNGKIALASDNPASLLSMATGFVPKLSTLKLAVGDAPVPLPAGVLPPGSPPAFVALSAQALAISLGNGEESGLVQFASAAPGTPPPLFQFGVDNGGMKLFFETARKATAAQVAAAEAMTGDADSQDEEDSDDLSADDDAAVKARRTREMQRAMAMFHTMEGTYLKSLDRVDMSIYATARGVEVQYAVRLK